LANELARKPDSRNNILERLSKQAKVKEKLCLLNFFLETRFSFKHWIKKIITKQFSDVTPPLTLFKTTKHFLKIKYVTLFFENFPHLPIGIT
jgi:hypothetical protein